MNDLHQTYSTTCLLFPAGCAVIRPWESIVIGMIGGAITVVGVPMFDKLRIDDPVGALSVHGLCGVWVSLLKLGMRYCKQPYNIHKLSK